MNDLLPYLLQMMGILRPAYEQGWQVSVKYLEEIKLDHEFQHAQIF